MKTESKSLRLPGLSSAKAKGVHGARQNLLELTGYIRPDTSVIFPLKMLTNVAHSNNPTQEHTL